MGKILQAHTATSDAYAIKNITFPGSWAIEFDFVITSVTLTGILGASSDFTGDFFNILNSGGGILDGIFLAYDGADWQYWSFANPGVAVGIYAPDSRNVISLEYDGTTITWKVDGTLVFSYTLDLSTAAKIQVGGQASNNLSNEFYYIDNVKAGTTLGATDLFSDNFESGTLSAWTSTFGDVSVIDDTGIGSGGGTTPSNTSCATAIPLVPNCSSMIINNSGAPNANHTTDPWYTVEEPFYSTGADLISPLWYKLTNTSSQKAYARFKAHNPTVTGYHIALALYTGSCAALVDPTDGHGTRAWLQYGTDQVLTWEQNVPAGGDSPYYGVVLNPGQTVYLQIAGDSSFGIAWTGKNLELQWQLLTTAFYDGIENTDNLDDGESESVVSGLVWPSWFAGENQANMAMFDYIKLGDVHYVLAGYLGGWRIGGDDNINDAHLWVYKIVGGVVTRYDLVTTFIDTDLAGAYGDGGNALWVEDASMATDGTHIWVVAAARDVLDDPWGSIAQDKNIDDPAHGGFGTGKWSPCRAWCWVSSGGAFTNLGNPGIDIYGHYVNDDPFSDFGSSIRCCASPSQPGILHVIWSGRGFQGVTFWDGGQVLEETWYLTFNSSGVTSITLIETQVSGNHLDTTFDVGHISSAWLGMTLTNDHGWPAVFNSHFTRVSGSGTLQFVNEINYIDLRTLTILQTLATPSTPIPEGIYWAGNPKYGWAISPPYADPDLSGTYVYYIEVRYGSFSRRIYRIPCDGSASFTFLNGDESQASLINGIGIPKLLPETRNFWVPIRASASPLDPGRIVYLDERCEFTWGIETPGDYDIPFDTEPNNNLVPLARGAYLEDDFIYWAGNVGFGTYGGTDMSFGVYKSKILRNFYVCSIGDCVIARQSIFWFFKDGSWHNAINDPNYNLWFYRGGQWRSDGIDTEHILYGQLDGSWQN